MFFEVSLTVENPNMRRSLFALVAVVAFGLLSSVNANAGLFGKFGCNSGCDVAPSCGCEMPAPVCCEVPVCEPSCCAPKRPFAGLIAKLHSLKASSCCDAAPVCCEAPAPVCCEIPAPSCGCEVAPSCGCEVSCCKPTPIRDMIAKLKARCAAKNSCCDVAPSCGCAVEPSCGCGM